MPRRRTVGYLVAALAGTSLAHAEEPALPVYAPPEFMTSIPPLPGSEDARSAWRLDLSGAIQLAVKRNLGVTLERKEVQIAALGETGASGAFEPTLDASFGHDATRTPPSTLQEGMVGEILSSRSDAWQVSLGQQLTTGTALRLGFTTFRASSTFGTAVAPINQRSSLAVSINQPLLRGFSLDLTIPRLPVLRARLASETARVALTTKIVDVVARTELAYWSVVQALFGYDLARRARQRAEEQLTLTRRKLDAGLIPPSDVTAAESSLAQTELDVLSHEQGIASAWDELRAELNLPRDQWHRPILPADMPRFTPVDTSLDAAMATAIARRPDLAQMALELQSQQLGVREAQNNLLPQIDLKLDANVVGQDERYAGTLDQIAGLQGRGWSALVSLSWTPLARATRAAAASARLRHEVVTTRRHQLEQQIWTEVRNALRNQRTAARQVLAAARFRELAEKTVDAEQRKFLSGNSAPLTIAQRQAELATAQLAELSAVIDHTKAAVALSRATGELLSSRNIELGVK